MVPIAARARSVSPVGGRRVRVLFTDGTDVEVDLTSFLRGPIFDRIREDPAAFADVRIAAVGGCLEWPGGADIDPELLYEHATGRRAAAAG